MLNALFDGGLKNHFQDPSAFRRWANQLPRLHGLNPKLVTERYAAINAHPELTELMKGLLVPSGKSDTELWISGGWGQDFLFVPTFPLWRAVHQNIPTLIDRMGRKLELHPLLVQQLSRSDHTSVADSAWVVAESRRGSQMDRATVKITYFDREMTPDGPWPRYSIETFPYGEMFSTYRRPEGIPSDLADEALAGLYSVRTSLEHWGLLPLEDHTKLLVPEHQPGRYGPEFAKLFTDRFFFDHMLGMEFVIEGFQKRDVTTRLQQLLDFRARHFPPEALEIGELGRFNIPEGSPPATKAQLYYGLVVLLHQRPIKKLYLMAPRPSDPNRPPSSVPQMDVLFSLPGFEWLRKAAEEAAAELDATTPYQSTVALPLRHMYEGLGFTVHHTLEHVMGLPNGCDLMGGPRDRVMLRLIDYGLRHREFLTDAQSRRLEGIRPGLHDEP